MSFDNLTPENIYHILDYLPANEVAAVCGLCRTTRNEVAPMMVEATITDPAYLTRGNGKLISTRLPNLSTLILGRCRRRGMLHWNREVMYNDRRFAKRVVPFLSEFPDGQLKHVKLDDNLATARFISEMTVEQHEYMLWVKSLVRTISAIAEGYNFGLLHKELLVEGLFCPHCQPRQEPSEQYCYVCDMVMESFPLHHVVLASPCGRLMTTFRGIAPELGNPRVLPDWAFSVVFERLKAEEPETFEAAFQFVLAIQYCYERQRGNLEYGDEL
uniref:F-box domain-containing protein n=1 Tax=Grammatophora oceanica TaxID=210454 RepID=A0A7S1Y3Z0_9STRA|mmetsp:Transcript_18520/g.27511  ORF Transcript_18520/g.27511 Transcript_18520/m.27511 type:complete len:272 (+) Transcript_18520:226-1041(+)|eukprot:CAMPEP_0194029508 /NCGR_PEP_ID=MMETSP0009_2-20130614/3212_1 /TAXON_ID=210454 /ORGANISM="Grammatophora oceanica, Strain CCMP 410" /LENGTH=271 /DNA_ID=CAMNT_0038669195 /DNA_START=134 /DNA_END=949 /DNA_ORIENTATION=+